MEGTGKQPGDQVAKLGAATPLAWWSGAMAKYGNPRLAAGVVVGLALLALGTACGSSGSDAAPSETSAAPMAAPTSSAPAGPADFSGVYKVAYEDGAVDTWSAKSCGPGCADVNQQMIGLVPSTINGQAHREGMTWKFVVSRFDAVVCDDGATIDGTSAWTWDATTLEGSLTSTQMFDGCDKPAGFETEKLAFTLTRTSSGAPPPGFRTS